NLRLTGTFRFARERRFSHEIRDRRPVLKGRQPAMAISSIRASPTNHSTISRNFPSTAKSATVPRLARSTVRIRVEETRRLGPTAGTRARAVAGSTRTRCRPIDASRPHLSPTRDRAQDPLRFGLAPPVSREDLLTAGTRTPIRSRTRRSNPYGNRPGPLTAYRAVVAAARAQSTGGVQVTGWEDVASCVRRLTGTCQEVAKSRYGRDTKVCFSRSLKGLVSKWIFGGTGVSDCVLGSTENRISGSNPSFSTMQSRHYFAVGHSSACFGFVKDWVEKKWRHQIQSNWPLKLWPHLSRITPAPPGELSRASC